MLPTWRLERTGGKPSRHSFERRSVGPHEASRASVRGCETGMRTTAVLLLLLYFGIFLVPKFFPRSFESFTFLGFFASLFLVLGILAILGVWGAIGMACSRLRQEKTRPRHRFLVVYAALGFVFFGVVITVHLIPFTLPSGSYQLKFNSSLWTSPESSFHVEGDITPRQKMLGDAVAVLPGRTRSEIEAVLGPSLDTPYFASTGRNMIYSLGRQRAVFSVDGEWLLIWLDESDRFLRYRIASD